MRANLLLLTAGAGCLAVGTLFFALGGAGALHERVKWISGEAQSAATFFVQSLTADQIQRTYEKATKPVKKRSAAGKVRVLIVPGHQPASGGAEFKNVYERDVVVDIADALAELLARNPHYEAMIARTKESWHPTLQAYFDTHAADIEAFIESQKALMAIHLSDGSILPAVDQVYHTTTPSHAALQLYGINKWASENRYHIVLHLHLNDYAGRRGSAARYDGFAIYVPDRQYSNAEASKAIGVALAGRINAFHATSTLPGEHRGVVEDQELIAIGSNNTADTAALLIEYGYIFEPQFRSASVRSIAVADYAYATYLGLQDFFNDPVASPSGSVVFPYDWSAVSIEADEPSGGVYALQAALRYRGHYPPGGKSLSQCPVSGVMGPCTRAALEHYQRARGLEATGTLGPQTRAALAEDTVY